MPQVIYAPAALRDLERLREFLRPKNPSAAKRAGDAILKAVQALGELPHIGRPIEDLSEDYREWLIDFGDSGYVARYRIEADTITVLAIRHQKEAGF
ncbi:plasmid stabilization protein [Litchfieldella qijiaojingensis]|uniref:Plasmid stabilization protein n=1 Tax=Litchfieldella qijiaojingensis TaxID=980347 RepID=A0ABQ2ZGN5_9GAMM|nr:type II toxin-antitoxin system RelE/ParE family toxin [Halomonas qijiaojingensis]GGY12501.1 plasmid stabilization protein [Halomonas qijiaojingensis]